MLPLHYNDLGFLCRELNSGLDLEKSYPTTGLHRRVLVRALYHRVVSINRPSGYEPDALPLRHDDLGVSLGSFEPPPLGSLVCDHYTTNGWFRSTSSNPPVCGHYTTMTCLIYAPFIFCKIFPSHISVTAFAVSIFPFFQTFEKYIVFQTDNFLQPVIKITFHMCPASQREHISVIDFTMTRLTTSITFNPCGIFFKDNLIQLIA